MGLVRYERYRAATLTERGREEALRLVRRHRLIETFLLEHLGVEESFTLSQAVADQRVRISKVRDEDAAMLDYLGDRNLVPGRRLSVREVRTLDGVVVVEDEEAEVHDLGEPMARSIFVRDDS